MLNLTTDLCSFLYMFFFSISQSQCATRYQQPADHPWLQFERLYGSNRSGSRSLDWWVLSKSLLMSSHCLTDNEVTVSCFCLYTFYFYSFFFFRYAHYCCSAARLWSSHQWHHVWWTDAASHGHQKTGQQKRPLSAGAPGRYQCQVIHLLWKSTHPPHIQVLPAVSIPIRLFQLMAATYKIDAIYRIIPLWKETTIK